MKSFYFSKKFYIVTDNFNLNWIDEVNNTNLSRLEIKFRDFIFYIVSYQKTNQGEMLFNVENQDENDFEKVIDTIFYSKNLSDIKDFLLGGEVPKTILSKLKKSYL